MYPPQLQSILALFADLPEVNRREMLISYSDAASKCGPRDDEKYVIEDVRKDEECTDTVGIYLRVDDSGNLHFRVSLGPHVQTLTRAMTSILCRGLDGCSAPEIAAVPADFVPKIVGAELVRLRSQTVYYVLGRIKTAAKMYADQLRDGRIG